MGFDEVDGRVVRGLAASFVSGIIWAAGWWCLIDGYGKGSSLGDSATAATASYAWVPPFFASLMYLCLNAMVRGSSLEGGGPLYASTIAAMPSRMRYILPLPLPLSAVERALS
jgi:hypothetical protein